MAQKNFMQIGGFEAKKVSGAGAQSFSKKDTNKTKRVIMLTARERFLLRQLGTRVSKTASRAKSCEESGRPSTARRCRRCGRRVAPFGLPFCFDLQAPTSDAVGGKWG